MTEKKKAPAKKAPAKKAPAKKAPAKKAAPGGDLAERMGALTAARRPAAPAAQKAPATMPATAETGPAFPKRITLPLSVADDRALKLAKIEDGVEATARIRAMLALWQEDERLRARIDKRAKGLSR